MLCNTHQTLNNHLKPNFINTIKFNNDVYQCELARKTFECNPPIQCGFFTLDNAKYWVLNFYYIFMEKYHDHTRFHYVEGDIDSLYFAISRDKNEGIKQRFKHIITGGKFYNESVYKWLPSDFYSSDNSNPTFETDIDKMGFDKKLLGYAIEKQFRHMIALAPKMYTAFNDNSTVSLKLKGVSIKQTNLNNNHYLHMLEEKCSIKSEQRNLKMYRNIMTKVNVNKTALSAFHNKYVILDDFSSCGRFL
jgi:hypothetical protein